MWFCWFISDHNGRDVKEYEIINYVKEELQGFIGKEKNKNSTKSIMHV